MNKIFEIINNITKNQKTLIMILCDYFSIFLSFLFTYYVYYNQILSFDINNFLYILFACFFSTPIFMFFGLYKTIIRYIDFDGIFKIFQSVSLLFILISVILFFFNFEEISKRLLTINFSFLVILICSTRILAKQLILSQLQYNEDIKNNTNFEQINKKNILIYGADNYGIQIFNNINLDEQYNIIGFIDLNTSKQGQYIKNYQVYSIDEINSLIKKIIIDEIIISDKYGSHLINEIFSNVEKSNIKILLARSYGSWLSDNNKINFKEIDIEDLLSRDTIDPKNELITKNIYDKSILITGAGGTIGSELSRIAMNQHPTSIILVENNEFSLYNIYNELKSKFANSDCDIFPILLNIEAEDALRRIIRKFKVDTLYHAAAYKHVDIVENNINFSLKNNILGTFNCAKIAFEENVKNFVLISSDKAVRPENYMGASKRFSELITVYFANKSKIDSKNNINFCSVRFGNVIGSSGSVIPLFKKQLKQGGPLTVTHKDMERYFMTTTEAAELVIQSSAMSSNGEIFILDMGEPVLINEIAKKIIKLSGFKLVTKKKYDNEIEILYIGLRPGEKMFEELFFDNNIENTSHPKIKKIIEREFDNKQFLNDFYILIKSLQNFDTLSVNNILSSWVEEFKIKK